MLVLNAQGQVKVYAQELRVRTEPGPSFVDLTGAVRAFVSESGVKHGLVTIFARHTTAAIRINENEPLLLEDLKRFLNQCAPPNASYEHDDLYRRGDVPMDEPKNAHSHCQHMLLGASETIPVVNGQMPLGKWQSIFLVELCSGRERNVLMQVIGSGD
ncbi:MAG: YjbQ family protein [Chloroflexi bacterium]|nr:YjbQ family protein [Chloroflexota bacterium]